MRTLWGKIGEDGQLLSLEKNQREADLLSSLKTFAFCFKNWFLNLECQDDMIAQSLSSSSCSNRAGTGPPGWDARRGGRKAGEVGRANAGDRLWEEASLGLPSTPRRAWDARQERVLGHRGAQAHSLSESCQRLFLFWRLRIFFTGTSWSTRCVHRHALVAWK